MDFQEIARQFTTFYYNTFDKNRQDLKPLYSDVSMFTFEDSSILGSVAIVEKLTSLPFRQVKHEVATIDAQPSGENGQIIILITGKLLVDEEQKPLSFSQAFQLYPDGQGSYFIFNDIFRLVYG
ncbi:unnamed protein product [Blumeria hordei]|uniref:Nuclear transport factor 2 n=1 Tax=Blumeria hordei TaxID=2867405 RepID=A0A383UHD7_BLUHO|nr:unnamed protein product [Blumeria hordei]